MDRWLGPLLGWDREGDLDKAPKILLGICGVQLLMLLLGLVIGFNNERCYIYVPEGGQIRIDCNDCNARTGPLIRDWFVMLLGVAAIGVGVHGALRSDPSTIRIYAYCMMVFAFVVGLSCVLTALEIPILHDAQDANQAELSVNQQCRETVESMISYTYRHAILYGVNCGLEIAGAWFAMRTNVYFDYEQVKLDHEKATKYGTGL